MSRKSKFSAEEKLKIIEQYLNGKKSAIQLSRIHDLAINTIYEWLTIYRYQGIQGLKPAKRNQSYSKELKLQVVQDYLSRKGSSRELAAKYGLRSSSQLKQWVLKYNGHIELKDYDPKSEVYMATSRRKTTQKERREIVDWCLNHDKNYKLAAEKFHCSYAQVYNWVRKFIDQGTDGLTDRRGRHKTESELTELEKANRKIKELEHKLKMAEMENEFSKKLQKLERELMLDEQRRK